jgi:Protein of unknown function (DUF3532).
MANRHLTDAQILAQIPAARKRERIARRTEPRATTAWYDRRSVLVTLVLTNHVVFSFPPQLIPAISDASPSELAEVKVDPSGEGLFWEGLNVAVSVPGLFEKLFGAKVWMRQLGKAGGRSKSAAKSRAARVNGSKGGRPHGAKSRKRFAAA